MVFYGAPSGESSFEVTDNGEALYRDFFKYQVKLCRGLQQGDTREAWKYQCSVFRKGIGVMKLKKRGPNTQGSSQGRDSGTKSKVQGDKRSSRPHKVWGRKTGRRQAERGDQHPHEGLVRFLAIARSNSYIDRSQRDGLQSWMWTTNHGG